MLGRMWRPRMYRWPVPMVLDTATNGSTRTLRVLARETRAKIGV
jgi:hypothetical protein